ncbi:MAG: hypothetical protein HND39_02920 [Ignavibacteriota bacterium]|jgi:hypothetical protein|nr:MAG: hypothetical protein EDM72_04590 [Chlorobiota bacterium]MBE7475210.1 hypothetical protein [Ignavibacteriales bacterium]MBL1122176.1 hypothetical protein [Ignavibacteriota bacterium]MBV6418909.1 hypothetical protein [Ignavibacteriaceae bacterium]MCE7856975.1 hypothetical protein [Ignavibacteria bacterium CHB3]MEB2296366.1 hypothetical protein [Ignavibacteria bacterium]
MNEKFRSEKEINTNIINTILTIQEKYPELSEYLGEMPVTIPIIKKPVIDFQNLSAYYDSLNSMLNSYAQAHQR